MQKLWQLNKNSLYVMASFFDKLLNEQPPKKNICNLNYDFKKQVVEGQRLHWQKTLFKELHKHFFRHLQSNW
jgi:hypothetical protein